MPARRATPEDERLLLRLFGAVYEAFGETGPEPHRLQAFIRSALTDAVPLEILVAESGSELVGMATLAFCPTTDRAACFAYLDDLHVLDDHRGRGHARALLSLARERALARGAVEVKLTADRDEHLLHLYREAGFRPASLPLLVLPLTDDT